MENNERDNGDFSDETSGTGIGKVSKEKSEALENGMQENKLAAEEEPVIKLLEEGPEEAVEESPAAPDRAAEKYEDFIKQEEAVDADRVSLQEEISMDKSLLPVQEKKSFNSVLRENKVLVAAVVVMVAVLIGVVLFYFGNKGGEGVNVPKKSGQNGNEIIKSSLETMKGVKNYSYEAKAAMGFSVKDDSLYSADKNNGDFQVNLSGASVESDQNNPANYISFGYSSKMGSGDGKSEAAFGAEFTEINKKHYIKFNNLSVLNGGSANYAEMQERFKTISGKWYSVSDEDYANLSSGTGYSGGISGLQNSQSELVKSFNRIIADHNFLKFSSDLGNENLEGVDCFHYKIDIDTKEAFELIAEILKEQEEQTGGDEAAKKFLEELKVNTTDIAKLKQVVDYVVKEVDVEVWIGKEDKLMRRVRIKGEFDKSFIEGFYGKMKEVYGQNGADAVSGNVPEINLNFDINLAFSKFNSSKVSEPENAVDFKEALNVLREISSSSGISPISVDSDDDGLSDEQEKFYGSDPAKPDTDGDGYKDGDEVVHGYDPIVAGSARLDYSKLYNVR